jgi:hypothetical protein
MSTLLSAWARIALLFAVVGCPLGPAFAGKLCPSVDDRMAGYTPTFRSGQEAPREGAFSLMLQPGQDVRYLSGPSYVTGEGGYGGVLVMRNLARATYRIFLSAAADVELVQNYVSLPLRECGGEDFGYVVAIDDGTIVLQLRAASVPVISIAFLRM